MTMTLNSSLFDINHQETMLGENKDENNNYVVNKQETIQNNIKCRYRRLTPPPQRKIILKLINCQYFVYIQHNASYINNIKET